MFLLYLMNDGETNRIKQVASNSRLASQDRCRGKKKGGGPSACEAPHYHHPTCSTQGGSAPKNRPTAWHTQK